MSVLWSYWYCAMCKFYDEARHTICVCLRAFVRVDEISFTLRIFFGLFNSICSFTYLRMLMPACVDTHSHRVKSKCYSRIEILKRALVPSLSNHHHLTVSALSCLPVMSTSTTTTTSPSSSLSSVLVLLSYSHRAHQCMV